MNLFAHFHGAIASIVARLVAAGTLPPAAGAARLAVEPPRDPAHGDVATNAAMVLAKPAGRPPRALAELLAGEIRRLPDVAAVDIAGPGFLNLRLAPSFWPRRLAEILAAGPAYGDSTLGGREAVNVEYVSANPTGLIHIGHARCAIIGDALAALLEKVGHTVTREYYINDAGAQIEKLVDSFLKRVAELRGEATAPFDGEYPGEEVIDAARAALADRAASGLAENDPESRRARARRFVVDYMMGRIREDLALLGVEQDVFTSERALVESGAVDAALAELEQAGLVYVGTLDPPKGMLPDDWEARPQTLFRSTRFGDDLDRTVRKADGGLTYFATDIGYHRDKVRRGFASMIDVWGADHGGHIKKMKAAVAAVTGGRGRLDVKLYQLVNLFDGGKPIRMSKRAGNVVTAHDVVERVGKDVLRFIMLTRKNDAPLDFDFAKVAEQSKDNPVFYVQYAHARTHSVFRQAEEALPGVALGPAALGRAALGRLTDSGELRLIKSMASWPRAVESAAEAHEPHRLAFYLYDLAADFHAHWSRGKEDPALRFVVESDAELTLARLALAMGVRHVIASGLRIFGVAPVEEMR
jgi:arginyl-tRNA synthetase